MQRTRRSHAIASLLAFPALFLLLATAALAGAPGPEDEEEAPERTNAVTGSEAPERAGAAGGGEAPLRATLGPEPSPESGGKASEARPPRPPLPSIRPADGTPRPVLDPAARLLSEDDASESWSLFVDLESGHRITQRFLLTNAGPGEHSAVAVGHLVTPGRAPYRYENGRRRSRWRLSEDRLFFDIAASHLDLHRPEGELRITKDDIEIRLFFEFREDAASGRLPAEMLPRGHFAEVLAIAAPTRGTLQAPWMEAPIETRGHTWLVHNWVSRDEAQDVRRRVEIYGREEETAFYGIQLWERSGASTSWSIVATPEGSVVDSSINSESAWRERTGGADGRYPIPQGFEVMGAPFHGEISLGESWLRFDPLEVIPQPFRWFIRRRSRPREVWADARISVSLSPAPGSPSLPVPGETTSANGSVTPTARKPRSQRETDDETSLLSATGSANGVASITFLNPVGGR